MQIQNKEGIKLSIWQKFNNQQILKVYFMLRDDFFN